MTEENVVVEEKVKKEPKKAEVAAQPRNKVADFSNGSSPRPGR